MNAGGIVIVNIRECPASFEKREHAIVGALRLSQHMAPGLKATRTEGHGTKGRCIQGRI